LRRGATLVELLVAMAVAGLVATFVSGWIVHASKMSAASRSRDDRDQDLSMARGAAFQDGTRGRTLSVSRSSWILERPRPAPDTLVDTIAWSVDDGFLRRAGKVLVESDTVLESAIVPHFSAEDPATDPWSWCDRDLDGAVDEDFISRLTFLEWTLVVRHRDFPTKATVVDTVRLVVPLRGPG
jgi:prepilin-type N-terminal cleavage/methylation domain-containing protein